MNTVPMYYTHISTYCNCN